METKSSNNSPNHNGPDDRYLRDTLGVAVLLITAFNLLVGARLGTKYFGYKQTYDHDTSRTHPE